MPLITAVTVECVFWAEDDGWKGICENLDIWVRGDDLAKSKKTMETALRTYARLLFEDKGT